MVFIMSIISFSIPSCKSAHEQESESSFKFDTMAVRVVPNSNYIIVGSKYHADIFLSAFSTTTPFELEMDSSDNPNQDSSGNFNQSLSYEKGVGSYEAIPDFEGTYGFRGKLKIKDPNGNHVIIYPFNAEYKVAKVSATIVPSEFVLFREKENKIDVSIPGIASEDINILVSNAKVSGENGKFTLIPGKENICLISVLARMKEGSKMFDQREYKVVDR